MKRKMQSELLKMSKNILKILKASYGRKQSPHASLLNRKTPNTNLPSELPEQPGDPDWGGTAALDKADKAKLSNLFEALGDLGGLGA